MNESAAAQPRLKLSGLVVGQVYRRTDLHGSFGGQRQGGISTPGGQSVILLFTGETGAQHGYKDGWKDDHFWYYGEGQEGDMAWVRGNAAVRGHIDSGRELLLFRILEQPRSHVSFLGRFIAAGWSYEEAPDRNEAIRRAIVFHLAPADRAGHDEGPLPVPAASMAELRGDAIKAGTDVPEQASRIVVSSFIERSRTVRAYALSRAGGICERCGANAPFETASGVPFLEVHHICRLSDGGPDRIDAVAAICPNCHREAHHGAAAAKLNADLHAGIQSREAEIGAKVATGGGRPYGGQTLKRAKNLLLNNQ